jgi:hypothetical protein
MRSIQRREPVYKALPRLQSSQIPTESAKKRRCALSKNNRTLELKTSHFFSNTNDQVRRGLIRRVTPTRDTYHAVTAAVRQRNNTYRDALHKL